MTVLHHFTPEQRTARHYPSLLTVPGKSPPPVSQPGHGQHLFAGGGRFRAYPLGADDSADGNPEPLHGWKLAGVIACWSAAMTFTTWLAGWLP